jgi:DNA-binding beta-propeller fold protein YncE
MYVDPKTNDLYVADGDGGARRLIVFDAETGAFRRIWGAYGERPAEGPAAKYDPNAPPSRSFSGGVHCVLVGNDGLVYVCDRNADRIQVFHQDGTFVREAFVSPKTIGTGTTFDIDFTPDQKYMYVADGSNQKVWILQRDSLEVVGSFGHLGHSAGQFRNVHGITVDSKGNVYTAEVSEGKRVQKFVLKAAGTKNASHPTGVSH